MTLPSVSIVINNYNYGRFLRQCIQSATSQTYKNLEIIVVDDGSTDTSREIIDDILTRHPAVKALFKKNGGQASAFNAGIQEAQGDLLLILDSDDYLAKTAVETAVNAFEKPLSRLSYGLTKVSLSGEILGNYILPGPTRFCGDLIDAILEHNFFPGTPTSGNLFRASAVRGCLPIPESTYRISADLYVMCKSADHGKIKIIPSPLGYYRVHGNNNFASSNGRFGLNQGQLKNQADNTFNSYQLLMQMVANRCFADQRKVQQFIFGMRTLELLSDAITQANGVRSNEFLDHGMVVNEAMKLLARGDTLSTRNLVGFFTIVANHVLPQSLSKSCRELIGRLDTRLKQAKKKDKSGARGSV